MKTQRILFIGAGRMAEAIFSGLVAHQQEHIDSIFISNHTATERLQEMARKYNIHPVTDWKCNFPNVDVIILACPPSAHPSVLQELNRVVNDQFVISVAAGIGLEALESRLPSGTPAAWVMPNTAAETRESMSIYAVGKHVTGHEKQVLEMILSGIGKYEECTEEQVHLLTAITGSAPAFLYSFCEALTSEAVAYGIAEEKARRLVSQMVFGSGAMLINGADPATLREQVTSPGGATAAGLAVLDNSHFHHLLKEAIRATNARAKELGKS